MINFIYADSIAEIYEGREVIVKDLKTKKITFSTVEKIRKATILLSCGKTFNILSGLDASDSEHFKIYSGWTGYNYAVEKDNLIGEISHIHRNKNYNRLTIEQLKNTITVMRSI